MYEFSSCGADCNTTLYIYDYCSMGNFDDTNEGSIDYDDNQGGCGEAATLTVLLEGGQTYWVRWASLDSSCGGFDWTFNYVGPPGCGFWGLQLQPQRRIGRRLHLRRRPNCPD